MKFVFIALFTVVLAGCAVDSRPDVQRAVGHWNFPVVGQLDAISVGDLAAAVQAIPQRKIYLLRVINHNRIEVEVTRVYRGNFCRQTIERVGGRWQATERVWVMS